jgi:O-antigen ligase/polysaccharide polymerase Wzy-like membrane protein
VSADPLLVAPGGSPGAPAGGGRVGLGQTADQRRLLAWAILGCVAIAVGSAAADFHATTALVAITGMFVVVAWQRYLLAWPTLLAYILLVILFIPIRRFTVGGGMPISLEPYRLLITLVLLMWLLAVLVDAKIRWRKTGFEGPIIAFATVAALGVAANGGWITGGGLTGAVLKTSSIFASFLLMTYFVTSAVTTRKQLDRIVALLVIGATIVAIATLIEWRTSNNLFNNMDRFIPVLRADSTRVLPSDSRGGRVRAYASAEHPIADGAMLVLMLPLAIYLYQRKRKPWWLVSGALLVFGALATGSRTAAGMLAALLIVFLFMKRKETLKLLPMLIPLFVACQIAMPGTLGTFKSIIFPSGSSVIAEQEGGQGAGEGRVADLGPSLEQFKRKPFLGQGIGTRLTSPSDPLVNARILDDQWLASLLEVGAFGVLALIWLYARAVRRLGRAAKRDDTPYGWLLAGLGAGLFAFAFGMLTYDAFSFIQVTFLSFVFIGLGASALRLAPASARPDPKLADAAA